MCVVNNPKEVTVSLCVGNVPKVTKGMGKGGGVSAVLGQVVCEGERAWWKQVWAQR